ncbi:MAG: DUF3616 domain-containing protein [Spirulinaceae cyanobacterium SM2_1_0]|nr:DUF3616 domain-containing protein [Spirulinaceae cyanobacterium SM2_1_0]
MSDGFMLGRILLQFGAEATTDLTGELSAVALTPDGYLLAGSDELLGIECLSPVAPYIYGDRRHFDLRDFLPMDKDDEIDIEGIDCTEHYLWFTGSHSSKRKNAKGKKAAKDIARLATIDHDRNRYLLARVPLLNGEPARAITLANGCERTAAALPHQGKSNQLLEALTTDEHLGAILSIDLPSKDNGFDIEALAVRGDRLFLGLRGPVLRGWAIILELAVEVAAGDRHSLQLQPIGPGDRCYRKHFLYLDGLGIRDLCFHGEDLLIVAGATMDVAMPMRVFCLKNLLAAKGDSLTAQDSDNLSYLFDLSQATAPDRSEGIAIVPYLGRDSLLVIYDSALVNHGPQPGEIYADVFRLPA